MTALHAIKYLRRREIAEAQWNNCVDRASNGLIYGYSFYLDAMASNWDALVLNDYEAVMPLPWRRKGGLAYLYQPFVTAQLGVFGQQLSAETVAAFLQAVPKSFRYWDFPMNHQNRFSIPGFPLHQRMNYVLPLAQPYAVLAGAYRENIRRNIRKSETYGCKTVKDIDLDSILVLTCFQPEPIAGSDLAAFRNLYAQLRQKGMAKTYGIASKQGDLLASAVFFFSHNRAYYILVGNHPNGRILGASHALIDAFIRDHAEQDLLLDFEGSDVRSLAFFYSSFGSIEEPYAAIKLNRLPWWIKWLK